MRRSSAVNLGVVGVLAATFSGCGEEEDVYCVDALQDNAVVENSFCGDEDSGGDRRYFLYYAGSSGGKSKKKFSKGQKIGAAVAAGALISSLDKSSIKNKGGFGKGSSSGVGRSVSKGGFGGFGGGG